MALYFLLMVILCNKVTEFKVAGCSTNIIVINDGIFELSVDTLDANSARNKCLSSDGNLVQIVDKNVKQQLTEFMEKKYTAHMNTVSIVRNPANLNLYKYRTDDSNDTTDIESWIVPKTVGELQSIKLYPQETDKFTQGIFFCWMPEVDRLQNKCPGNWSINFKLYGTQQSGQTVKIYNYLYSAQSVQSNALSNSNKVPSSSYRTPSYNPIIYLSDASVYVGGRSEVNQTKWFWNDGRMINDTSYPKSKSSSCQQMSWPLTYNDNKNLLPKTCTRKAYYACQYNFNASLSAQPCNATVLKLSWNVALLEKFKSLWRKSLKIYILENNRSFTTWYNNSPFIITNLTTRTKYTVQITVEVANCSKRSLTAFASATTGYSVPDVVKDAHVTAWSGASHNCVVEWKHDPDDINALSYKITGKSGPNVSDISVNIIQINDVTEGNWMFQDLSFLLTLGYTAEFRFMITAMSCGKQSKATPVLGFCISSSGNRSQNTSPQSNVIDMKIVIGILAALICVFIILGVV